MATTPAEQVRIVAWFRWAKDRLWDDHEFRAVYRIVVGED